MSALTGIAGLLLGEMTASAREGWVWFLAAGLLVLTLCQVMPSGKLPTTGTRIRVALCGFCGLLLLWYQVPRMGALPIELGFWVFACVTLVAAVATISSRSPMYCAIWFAVTLLGTAALMLLQGAQFLGIATVAVYAGAIVVTFLFVLMLSQPEGHSFYDRISWGAAPRLLGAIVSTMLVLIVAMAVVRPDADALADRQADVSAVQAALTDMAAEVEVRGVRYEAHAEGTLARISMAADRATREQLSAENSNGQQRTREVLQGRHASWRIQPIQFDFTDVRATNHTAHLGAQLFSRQLIGVQFAGVLLLAALVGAVAMAARGGDLDERLA